MPFERPVLNRLGAIARTRMPREPRSRAIVSAMPAMPALAAEYATWPIWPSNAAIDAVLMITPRSSSSGSFLLMCHACSRLRLNVPIRLRSMTWRNSSSGCGPVVADRAHGDAATGGVHRDVQTAERLDRLVERDLGPLEVGDVAAGGTSPRAPWPPPIPATWAGRRSRPWRRRATSCSAVARAMPDAPPTTIACLPWMSTLLLLADRRAVAAPRKLLNDRDADRSG